MFEKFLAKSVNSIKLGSIDEEFISQYQHRVSSNLILLWKEISIGIYCDGLFKIVKPDEFQEIVDECYPMDGFGFVTPFMVTAFGDIFAYVKDCRIDDYVVFINVRYGTFKILSDNIEVLINMIIFNKGCLESWFSLEKYEIIKKLKGSPDIDECYGYVPALVAGGQNSIDNIQIVKIIPYIDILIQLTGNLKRDK
jgi:hypothetical protein